jgi:hypothetical protein
VEKHEYMKEKKQNQTGRPAWSYIISGGGEKKGQIFT